MFGTPIINSQIKFVRLDFDVPLARRGVGVYGGYGDGACGMETYFAEILPFAQSFNWNVNQFEIKIYKGAIVAAIE